MFCWSIEWTVQWGHDSHCRFQHEESHQGKCHNKGLYIFMLLYIHLNLLCFNVRRVTFVCFHFSLSFDYFSIPPFFPLYSLIFFISLAFPYLFPSSFPYSSPLPLSLSLSISPLYPALFTAMGHWRSAQVQEHVGAILQRSHLHSVSANERYNDSMCSCCWLFY